MSRQALDAESIARAFHERYEQLAPEHGYETRKDSAVPWEDVPASNKALMIAVARSLLADGVIACPDAIPSGAPTPGIGDL